MDQTQKFKIITEGQKYGVSNICQKYRISRTLYYRWLKKYKKDGFDGLRVGKQHYSPVNKTKLEVEKSLLGLIKHYPEYGPKALKYLLEESGYTISESAVYNVLCRNNLNTKAQRLKLVNRRKVSSEPSPTQTTEHACGESWIAWITHIGSFAEVKALYVYTIFDVKSKIACSRLYNTLSKHNFEDLLTAVALPVAQSLSFNLKQISILHDPDLWSNSKQVLVTSVNEVFQGFGLDTKILIYDPAFTVAEIISLKEDFTEKVSSALLKFLAQDQSFQELKINFQRWIRFYNIHDPLSYTEGSFPPIEYYMVCTNTQLVLPLWAYIERDY